APTISDRFPGGLSYRPCPNSISYFATGYHGMSVPFVPAPVDTFRVGMTGGPTTPGAADAGTLYVPGSGTLLSVSGEVTVTSDLCPVGLHDYPHLPDLALPVNWAFYTQRPASYDVATFTVEYRHYVPVASRRP